jgi:hypothetical protein
MVIRVAIAVHGRASIYRGLFQFSGCSSDSSIIVGGCAANSPSWRNYVDGLKIKEGEPDECE